MSFTNRKGFVLQLQTIMAAQLGSAANDLPDGESGLEGRGTLTQGFLEMSNVKVVEEMINLISTQRAYEVNSKVIQAADEMMRNTSQLG